MKGEEAQSRGGRKPGELETRGAGHRAVGAKWRTFLTILVWLMEPTQPLSPALCQSEPDIPQARQGCQSNKKAESWGEWGLMESVLGSQVLSSSHPIQALFIRKEGTYMSSSRNKLIMKLCLALPCHVLYTQIPQGHIDGLPRPPSKSPPGFRKEVTWEQARSSADGGALRDWCSPPPILEFQKRVSHTHQVSRCLLRSHLISPGQGWGVTLSL